MKQLLISFLFFVVCNNCGYCKNWPISYQTGDSLSYYYYLVDDPKTSSSLTKAYVFFNKQVDKSLEQKDTISSINHLRLKAIIQNKLGDYYGSETTAVRALDLVEHLPINDFTQESKMGIFNQLGRINSELLNYETALEYYNKALKIAKEPITVSIIRNNIGLIYLEQLNYEKAEKEFLAAYKNSLLSDDKKEKARALDNLGYVQHKLNREASLEKLNEALKMRVEIEDNDGIYSSYKNLSQYHKDKNDLDKASSYANKAYLAAKKLNSASYIEDALSTIISLSPDPKTLEYKKLKDSIESAKQIAENKYALIKFNYLKQEQIANENKILQEKEKANRIFYQALGVLILTTSFFLYFLLKSKHRKDKIQIVYNTESRISKKVHDELANDMYYAMAKLQNDPNNNEALLNDLEKIYIKTRDISKGIGEIDVETNFQGLLYDLLINYNSEQVSIITKNLNNIDWNTVDQLKKETIYRVLQELMTNMRKHSKATVVLVSFSQNNKLVIDYKDNGIGCNLKKSGGLQNAENRIKSINGTIIFESNKDNGFKAKISI